MNQDDHDILIALVEQVRALRADIAEMKDNIKSRVDDHERRIRFLEKYIWAGLAIVGFISFITPYLWNTFHK